jgi:hypothetical protein
MPITRKIPFSNLLPMIIRPLINPTLHSLTKRLMSPTHLHEQILALASHALVLECSC